jgi:hypothetical protein
MDGYYLPRHTGSGQGPGLLGVGTVQLRSGCFYLEDYLLIWPETYSLVKTDGGVSVQGDGFTVTAGSEITYGGAAYEPSVELPDAAKGALLVPCPGPYIWVSEVSSVKGAP